MTKTEKVLLEVLSERGRQDKRFGVQDHDVVLWSLILAEEFGEVCKESNEIHFRRKASSDYRKELIQVAAVAVAAIEALDRSDV